MIFITGFTSATTIHFKLITKWDDYYKVRQKKRAMKKSLKKMNSHCLKLYLAFFISFNLSIVGNFFFGVEL